MDGGPDGPTDECAPCLREQVATAWDAAARLAESASLLTADVHALVDERVARRADDDWQPIETAPRHTWCLVWFNDVAWEARLAGGGWRAPSDTELYPTHWRPMPEGPR